NVVTSIPAQNDFPSPPTSTRRTGPSMAASCVASPSSSNMPSFMALRLSGRASVIDPTPSATSYRSVVNSAMARHAPTLQGGVGSLGPGHYPDRVSLLDEPVELEPNARCALCGRPTYDPD